MKNKSWVCLIIMITWQHSARADTLPIHDPTAPPASMYVIPDKHGYVLNAILISPERKIAVINGEILNAGDDINGAQLLDIQDNQVTLKHQDEKIILYLVKEKIRQE